MGATVESGKYLSSVLRSVNPAEPAGSHAFISLYKDQVYLQVKVGTIRKQNASKLAINKYKSGRNNRGSHQGTHCGPDVHAHNFLLTFAPESLLCSQDFKKNVASVRDPIMAKIK